MVVEYATTERFDSPRRVPGPDALETSDFTARVVLTNLPQGQRIFYRVLFQDLADIRAWSRPGQGSFMTPSAAGSPRDVTLAWSADTVGQGWGINPEWGGLRLWRIRNVVWLTADVHYCAAHHYDPSRAAFTEFDPFWEFVAGPLNAGTFAPGAMDPTFGPEVKFTGTSAATKPNRPPSEGLQYFGTMTIAARTRALTVRLRDLEGKVLYSVELVPE